MSKTVTRRAALAGMSTSAAAVVFTATPAAALPSTDHLVDLWRRWQALEDRRAILQARRQALFESLPEEMRELPGVHYATYYQTECAPGQQPKGQKLVVCWEDQIDRLSVPVEGGPGYMERLDAARADLKRRLLEAREQHNAECDRVGLTALDDEIADTTDAALYVMDEIKVGVPASPAELAAVLFMGIQHGPEQHRSWPISSLPVVEITIGVIANLSPLPADLKARIDRLAAASPDGNLGEALRPIDAKGDAS